MSPTPFLPCALPEIGDAEIAELPGALNACDSPAWA